MGWERKRGKLMEFNRLLLGEDNTSYTTQVGDVPALIGSRYVITLDSDTVLPRTAARDDSPFEEPYDQKSFEPGTGGPHGGV